RLKQILIRRTKRRDSPAQEAREVCLDVVHREAREICYGRCRHLFYATSQVSAVLIQIGKHVTALPADVDGVAQKAFYAIPAIDKALQGIVYLLNTRRIETLSPFPCNRASDSP